MKWQVRLFFCQQSHCVDFAAFPASHEAEFLGGRGLNRHTAYVRAHYAGEGFAHFRYIRGELGPLHGDET